jgi:hypothetical protein
MSLLHFLCHLTVALVGIFEIYIPVRAEIFDFIAEFNFCPYCRDISSSILYYSCAAIQ